MVFIDYSNDTEAYRLLDLETSRVHTADDYHLRR
jgi:hypothetical protein